MPMFDDYVYDPTKHDEYARDRAVHIMLYARGRCDQRAASLTLKHAILAVMFDDRGPMTAEQYWRKLSA